MNYANIKYYDIANGEGVRTSLFVSGCTHHCRGCFNPETWDFSYGKPFTEETVEEILASLEPEYIAGLTILGGEPFEPENQEAVLSLVRSFRERYPKVTGQPAELLPPKKNIWCYTGYTYETDLKDPAGKAHTPFTEELLKGIDVLVDGEFIEGEKDITLKFRGSRNQRILTRL